MMASSNASPPKVVSRQEWLGARKAHFLKEKAMTHALDELRAERRRLPWVKVGKPYVYPDSAEIRRKCLPSAAEAILLDR
jgi:predicted dithiol-disulfide oxidoreductase (DUF899 family)